MSSKPHRLRVSILVLAATVAGCRPSVPPPPSAPFQVFVGNGAWGARVGVLGLGDGPYYESEATDKGPEEKLRALPSPFRERLWWTDSSGNRLDIVLTDPTFKHLGTAAEFTARFDGQPGQATARIEWGNQSWATYRLTSSNPNIVPHLGDLAEPIFSFGPKGSLPAPGPAEIEIDTESQADRDFVSDSVRRLKWELPRRGSSIGPMGLSSDVYFGHTFWDADVWMMPALVFVAPETARSLASYRLLRLHAARKNFARWVSEGRPTGSGKLRQALRPSVVPPAKYPWESGTSGLETVPGPSRFEEHISGSVWWGLRRAEAFGLADGPSVRKVEQGVAAYVRARSEEIRPGEWGLRGVMSPDEHHVGDNDLYTNLIYEQLMTASGQRDWRAYRPRDKTSLLTYDHDALRGYKQAAAVLAIYPLQDPEAESAALTMLRRFGPLVTENGPAMTKSVHATILARFGDTEEAYREWISSWKPYLRGPAREFSEKLRSTQDRTVFYTGIAGALQTVIYGFAGARVDDRQPKGVWTERLPNGQWLSFQPHLPKAWRAITLKNCRIGTQVRTVVIDRQGVHVSPGN